MLHQVSKCIKGFGWPNKLGSDEDALGLYFACKVELAVSRGLIHWGHRATAPASAKEAMMQILHGTLRSLFWFPGLDKDIKSQKKTCPVCV